MPPPPRPNWQRPHHRDTGSWSLSRPIRTAACETAVRPPPRLKPVLHDSAACFGSLEGFKLLSLWVQLERLLHRLSATSSSPHSLAVEVPTLRNGMALKSFSLAALKSYRTYSQARARGGGGITNVTEKRKSEFVIVFRFTAVKPEDRFEVESWQLDLFHVRLKLLVWQRTAQQETSPRLTSRYDWGMFDVVMLFCDWLTFLLH